MKQYLRTTALYRRPRGLALWVGLPVIAMTFRCSIYKPDYEGFRCAAGECMRGYVCHPERNLCVRPLAVDCEGSGLCPIDVFTDDPCPFANAFIPCHSSEVDCVRGCRTCQEDQTWSACSVDPCLSSDIEICDGLDNDCNNRVDDMDSASLNAYCNGLFPDAHVATWICDQTCVQAACQTGYHDIDPAIVGCEYACSPSNHGVEICDGGIDNDCNGTADVEPDLQGCERYLRDDDGDGYGVTGASTCFCQPTAPYTATLGNDCDDDPKE